MTTDASDTSDDELVVAAASGNARAFDTLIVRHQAKVLRVLLLLGVSRDDVDDAAQEVFLRSFRSLGGFRRGKPFGAWLYRIAVNTAHEHRARSRGRRQDQLDDAFEAADDRPGAGADAELEASALRRRLVEGLSTLTERERAVFILREVEGLETAEIAVVLGITGITVRRHLGLARERLRRFLNPE